MLRKEVYPVARKLLLFICLLLINVSSAWAQSVTVTGEGETREQSIAEGKRLAVEQVAGSYISAHSYMKNFQLELDEVISNSQGFITGYRILSEQSKNGRIYITLSVDVDTTGDSSLLEKLKMVSELRDPRIGVVVFDASDGLDSAKEYQYDSFSDPEDMGENELIYPAQANMDQVFLNNADEVGIEDYEFQEGRSVQDVSLDVNVNVNSYQEVPSKTDNKYYLNSVKEAINKELIAIGFNHVVDISQTIMQHKAGLLRDIAMGLNWSGNRDNALDYLIVGYCSVVDTHNITLPTDGYHREEDIGLTAARVNLAFKVLQYDTGLLAGSGQLNANGIDLNENLAIDKAFQKAAVDSCIEVKRILGKRAGLSAKSIELEISFASTDSLNRTLNYIKNLPGINNVNVFEENDKALKMYVDTDMQPHSLVELLKRKNDIGVFVETIRKNSMKLHIS